MDVLDVLADVRQHVIHVQDALTVVLLTVMIHVHQIAHLIVLTTAQVNYLVAQWLRADNNKLL